ncbi:MAG: tRNA (adenosine(37)-N6)-dimethylallyltransferase MiaA [Lachnospiraceae bacterium]
MKRKLIILTGPTAVGKTATSISFAQKIGGEIVSADSMQVYRHMDIGSAKIMPEEMQGVPHHLIDVLDPSEEFNVVRFQQMALEAMEGIYQRGHIPIVTGGTGFYIQALLNGIEFEDTEENTEFRIQMEQIAEEKGNVYLHEQLKKVDPKSAETIHPNNRKRVIRALEYFTQTNTPISEHNEEQREKEAAYDFVYFVLNRNREELYLRIDQRVDMMMKQGLLEEVKWLAAQGCTKDMVSMKGLGYKELLTYLDGECSLEEAIYTLKRDTRHFAKRQLTWFRREKSVTWICVEDYPDTESLVEHLIKICQEKGIVRD